MAINQVKTNHYSPDRHESWPSWRWGIGYRFLKYTLPLLPCFCLPLIARTRFVWKEYFSCISECNPGPQLVVWSKRLGLLNSLTLYICFFFLLNLYKIEKRLYTVIKIMTKSNKSFDQTLFWHICSVNIFFLVQINYMHKRSLGTNTGFVSHLTEEAWLTVSNLFCESSSFGCFSNLYSHHLLNFNNSIVIFKFQKQYFISDFQTMSHDKPEIWNSNFPVFLGQTNSLSATLCRKWAAKHKDVTLCYGNW